MKKLLTIFKKGWLIVLLLAITGAGIGVTYTYNFIHDTYSINFKYAEGTTADFKKMVSEENVEVVQNITTSYFTGGKISTYSYVEPKNLKVELVDGYYKLSMNTTSLSNLPSTANKNTVSKGFLKHLAITYLNQDDYTDYDIEKVNKDGSTYNVTIKGSSNAYISNGEDVVYKTDNQSKAMTKWGIIGGVIGLLVGIVLIIILGFKFSDKLECESIYDNEEIFKTPFHKKYWSHSAKEFKSVKKMAIMSMLLALTLIFKLVKIPSGFGNLGFGFGLIFLSVACMIGGPLSALIIGAISDTLGFFIEGGGTFNLLYTAQAMLSCFFYAIFLYRTRINFTRVLISRICINFICNVLIGSIAWGIISGFDFKQTVDYMLTLSLPKNVAFLVPQAIIMYIILLAVTPIASQTDFIDERIGENITIF